jgi:hypothetical protein
LAVPEGNAVLIRRRRGRRLVLTLVLVLVLLVIAAMALVQVVLWSDVPRATIVRELQAETGLRIEAATSRTRWGGTTELRDVSIALPLADDPFMWVPVLRVRHTRPLGLAIGPVEVYEATFESPRLRFEQDELGRWNAVRAIEIVQARQAERPSPAEQSPLPRLLVVDGVLELPREEGGWTELPLAFEGVPEGAVTWAFQLRAGEALSARGRLAPHGEWQHQVEAVFGDDQAILDVLAPEQLLPLRGAVRWQGGLSQGSFAGRLSVERFRGGDLQARGEAGLSATGGRIVVRPRNLEVGSVEMAGLRARIVSGSLTMEGSRAHLQRLRLEGGGATAELSGQWDLEQESGEMTANWWGAAPGPVLGHEGELRLTAMFPEGSAASMRASVRSSGTTAQGAWDSVLQFSLSGSRWERMIGEISAERLVWRDDQGPIELGGASARIETDWPLVRLSRLEIPGAERSSVQAWLDAPAMSWWLEGEAAQWDIPRIRGGLLDLRVRAEGTPERVNVAELRVHGGGLDARASGEYDLQRDQPLRAMVRATYEQPQADGAENEAGEKHRLGAWLAQAEVSGTLQPLHIAMLGELQGRDVQIGDARVEQVIIPFSGSGTEEGAEFDSGRFDLLGASWQVQGQYVDRGRSLALQAAGEAIPLQQVAHAFEIPLELPGTGDARIGVLVPGLNLNAVQIEGSFAVVDIDRPDLRIERGRGEIVTRGGMLTLRDLELTAGDSVLRGSIQYNLRQREDLRLDITTRAWPLSVQGVPVTAVTDGHARVMLNLEQMSFRGTVDAAADVALEGNSLGRMSAVAVLDGRKVDVQRIVGSLCQGTIEGRAQFSLDDMLQIRTELTLSEVDLAELSMCLGFEDQFAGRASATLNVGPAADRRAPEPLALSLRISGEEAAYRTINFGGAEINAFFGERRTVLDRSTVSIADGTMTIFSRLSRHEGARFAHVQTNIDSLDIDQFYRAFAPEEGPLPGLLSGQAAFGGYLEEPHRLFGEARLNLIESDLANLPAIAAVYNLLNLRFGTQEPRGRGEVRVRLEGNALEVFRLRYFNRGADIAASLRVEDVRLGGSSPISGVAAGSIRPLRDLDIPLLDVDRMLSGLQTGAASVEIRGTLVERDIRVVPFADISARLTRILTGRTN